MGVEGYGVYAYALVLMSFLMVIAEFGVPTLLVRELAASEARNEWGYFRGSVRWSFSIVLLAAGFVTAFSIAIIFFNKDNWSNDYAYTLLWSFVMLPFLALSKVSSGALRGLQKIFIAQVLESLFRPFFMLLILFYVFLEFPESKSPHVVMMIHCGVSMVLLVLSVYLLRRHLPQQASNVAPLYCTRKWNISALSLMLSACAGVINNQADLLVLGIIGTPAEVGVYRVAMQLAMLVSFGLHVINIVVAPQFAGLYASGNKDKLQKLVKISSRVMLLAALPIVIGIFIIGKDFVKLVYGEDYVESYLPLVVLSVGQLVNAAVGAVGQLLNMTGHEYVVASTLLRMALLNVVLNFLLIRIFGVVGAALATTVTLSAWNMLLYLRAKQKLEIRSCAW